MNLTDNQLKILGRTDEVDKGHIHTPSETKLSDHNLAEGYQ